MRVQYKVLFDSCEFQINAAPCKNTGAHIFLSTTTSRQPRSCKYSSHIVIFFFHFTATISNIESPIFFCVSEDRCNATSLADTYMFTYSSLKQISNIYTGYTIEYYMTLRTGVTKTTSPFFIAQSAFLIQFLFSFWVKA